MKNLNIMQIIARCTLFTLIVGLTACGPTEEEISLLENQGMTMEEIAEMELEEIESALSSSIRGGRGRRLRESELVSVGAENRDEHNLDMVKVERSWWRGLECVVEQSDIDKCESILGAMCEHGVVVTAFPGGGMCNARCNCSDADGNPIGGLGTIVDQEPI